MIDWGMKLRLVQMLHRLFPWGRNVEVGISNEGDSHDHCRRIGSWCLLCPVGGRRGRGCIDRGRRHRVNRRRCHLRRWCVVGGAGVGGGGRG